MTQDEQKRAAAETAIQYIPENCIVGVGTGSTANYFIDELARIKHKIEGAVASSEATSRRLKAHGIKVFDLNDVDSLNVYVDGADEINRDLQMIKGGGGALTREKIVAAVAKTFICMADQSKFVQILGMFPLPVEIIPMARGHIAREIMRLGGQPVSITRPRKVSTLTRAASAVDSLARACSIPAFSSMSAVCCDIERSSAIMPAAALAPWTINICGHPALSRAGTVDNPTHHAPARTRTSASRTGLPRPNRGSSSGIVRDLAVAIFHLRTRCP